MYLCVYVYTHARNYVYVYWNKHNETKYTIAMYSDNFYSVLCNFNFKAIRDNLVF